jgi:predicted SprT family Zn-dependent metalloprotease
MRKHHLEIEFNKKEPPDCVGSYLYSKRKSTMYICTSKKDHKDTLIHELTHFVLAMITGKWYSHGKKFNKLYKVLKSL